MKKTILIILILIVSYILAIFMLPSVAAFIWEKVWLTNFNNSVIKTKVEFNNFMKDFDLLWKYKQSKNKAQELKNWVEIQIKDTKQKIEEIQNQATKTKQSIDETTNSINNTIDSINNLKDSVGDIVNPSISWSLNIN